MARLSTEKIWEFADALKQSFSTPSDTRAATVQSVDNDGTVWVVYPGASSPTPIASVGAAVEPGDYVYTQLLNGRLVLTTNKSDPASGVKRTRSIVNAITQPIDRAVVIAKGIADEAKAVANAINQHFWSDDNGVHVTDVTQDEWKAAVDDGFSDYDADTKPYHNLLMNSLGILLRTALNNLVSITRSAIAFYDGTGNAASNIVARFGSAGAQIGLTGESHVSIDYHSLEMVDKQNNTYFRAADLRDTDGVATLYSGYILLPKKQFTASVPIYGVQEIVLWSGDTGRALVSTEYTVSGNTVTITAETTENDTRWDMWYTTTSEDAKAFTLGQRINGRTLGASSVSEGYSDAVGAYAHSEGYLTRSNGENSHAEGNRCYADGKDSHAQNTGTKAASASQTTMGKYNVEDTNDEYALIIGNGGGSANRSNAFAVDWDGNITQAVDVPWTELPLASGWVAYSTGWTPRYRRSGNVVQVKGAVKPTAAQTIGDTGITFATLPDGCRPSGSPETALCQASGTKIWLLNIESSGVMTAARMRTMNSTSYQSASTSEWMTFDVTFLL